MKKIITKTKMCFNKLKAERNKNYLATSQSALEHNQKAIKRYENDIKYLNDKVLILGKNHPDSKDVLNCIEVLKEGIALHKEIAKGSSMDIAKYRKRLYANKRKIITYKNILEKKKI